MEENNGSLSRTVPGFTGFIERSPGSGNSRDRDYTQFSYFKFLTLLNSLRLLLTIVHF